MHTECLGEPRVTVQVVWETTCIGGPVTRHRSTPTFFTYIVAQFTVLHYFSNKDVTDTDWPFTTNIYSLLPY